ncbi:MAG TPA: argininosuccinate lyase [Treponemataceae bacterium]|nr:argininosuccinate lyase [Treponemataceae bacterium]
MDNKKTVLNRGTHSALWHGRFKEGPDAQAVEFETSIYVDERMVFDDIRGSQAHVRMLGKQKIIPEHEAQQIIKCLDSIKADLESSKLKIDYTAEDIHSFIEGVLTDRLGDIGKKVHTGRSRNDQVALDERLYFKKAIPELKMRLRTLIDTLATIASKHTESLLSGYTHMQRAQPVTLAHHLCAWAWMLVRDCGRLDDALKRMDFCPLGAGALAGSGLPLDREMTAFELGFSAPTQNSLDSVSDRDFLLEFSSAFALIQMHLSRFCEEVIIWATEEFNFIQLSERWSTGSSIMPQKKNPDFAELIRGRTGKVYGGLFALLTTMKGLPLAYNRDMQEDKEPVFDAYDTVFSCLGVFTRMIASAHWNVERMEESCTGGHANATDLADYLVRKGMPFRTAHGVAATAVRECVEKDINLEDLPIQNYKKISSLINTDIYDYLSPRACVNARKTIGGPYSKKVEEQIKALKRFAKKV